MENENGEYKLRQTLHEIWRKHISKSYTTTHSLQSMAMEIEDVREDNGPLAFSSVQLVESLLGSSGLTLVFMNEMANIG